MSAERKIITAVCLAAIAILWTIVNGPVEGPILVVLVPRHGVTAADVPSIIVLGCAVGLSVSAFSGNRDDDDHGSDESRAGSRRDLHHGSEAHEVPTPVDGPDCPQVAIPGTGRHCREQADGEDATANAS